MVGGCWRGVVVNWRAFDVKNVRVGLVTNLVNERCRLAMRNYYLASGGMDNDYGM